MSVVVEMLRRSNSRVTYVFFLGGVALSNIPDSEVL